MSIRWCAFMAALMIAFAVFTFQQKAVLHDPPGVTTRWWDGTTQSIDTKYPDGKLFTRTVFGADGTTMVAFGSWDKAGVLRHTKVRQKDGTVEDKLFDSDGVTLTSYTLWNGDMQTTRIRRQFYRGTMTQEVIYNEEGSFPQRTRDWNMDGKLSREVRLLDNADQKTDNYTDGQIYSTSIFKANGDQHEISYHYPGGPIYSRDITVAMDRSGRTEYYDGKGQLVWLQESPGDSHWGSYKISTFENGVVTLKQTYDAGRLTQVEQFSATGKPTRTLLLNGFGRIVNAVKLFREDGTLATLKQMDNNGRIVIKQITYDAAGTTVVEEKSEGELEVIDRHLLDAPPVPSQIPAPGGAQ